MNELLAVVQAEEQVEAAIAAAKREQEDRLASLREERERLLAGIAAPKPAQVTLPALRPNLEKLKTAAARNRRRAVAQILEAIHAAA